MENPAASRLSRVRAVAPWLGLALALGVATPDARAVTISDATGSITVNDSHGGLTNFTVAGNNDVFEVVYYYRTAAMTEEAPIAGRLASAVVTSVSQTAADTITVLGSVAEFDYQLDYVLTGASLSLSLTLDETNGTPLSVSLFGYQDLDLGSGADDLLAWDGSVMTLSDPVFTRTLEVTTTTAADAAEAAAYDAIRSSLEDASITNLSDGSGLPFGPGDATFAFQYDRALAANGSDTIDLQMAVVGTQPVPEPGTAGLTALGLVALGLVRRRR